eukprot:1019120-Pelagomonas_calceolata.AAC.1
MLSTSKVPMQHFLGVFEIQTAEGFKGSECLQSPRDGQESIESPPLVRKTIESNDTHSLSYPIKGEGKGKATQAVYTSSVD